MDFLLRLLSLIAWNFPKISGYEKSRLSGIFAHIFFCYLKNIFSIKKIQTICLYFKTESEREYGHCSRLFLTYSQRHFFKYSALANPHFDSENSKNTLIWSVLKIWLKIEWCIIERPVVIFCYWVSIHFHLSEGFECRINCCRDT